jgi:hypothetical protein
MEVFYRDACLELRAFALLLALSSRLPASGFYGQPGVRLAGIALAGGLHQVAKGQDDGAAGAGGIDLQGELPAGWGAANFPPSGRIKIAGGLAIDREDTVPSLKARQVGWTTGNYLDGGKCSGGVFGGESEFAGEAVTEGKVGTSIEEDVVGAFAVEREAPTSGRDSCPAFKKR